MTRNFCTRTARRITKLGYAPKVAIRYARFFFFSMLSVCAAMGVLNVPSNALIESITGSGKSPAGARTGISSPDFFGLR